MHLMVTSLCDRDCKYCCNKQYDLNSIPYATDEELREVETLYLTGGEPFAYTKPNAMAYHYKHKYPNIMRVIVYTNACELWSSWITNRTPLGNIDGLNISIKNLGDYLVLDDIIRDKEVCSLPLNRIYVFGDRLYEKTNSLLTEYDKLGRFQVIRREWQEDFKPADDSIFRRV
jgi:MoaA/NifB/PqqE/SkfB family radical SAM enzyme